MNGNVFLIFDYFYLYIRIFQIEEFARDFSVSCLSSLNDLTFYIYVPFKVVPYIKRGECERTMAIFQYHATSMYILLILNRQL